MARTLNPTEHAVRREAFVDVAQRLIQTRGYEAMSVQDVLDALEASRGAFYHYFDSKEALLDAVIERIVDDALAAQRDILADPGLIAPRKLGRLFSGIASFKTERTDLMLALIRVWMSDANAIVRDKFRRRVRVRLSPMLADIVRQGCAEGTFRTGDPDAVGGVLVSLILGINEVATELFLARQADAVPFDEVERALAAYGDAMEQILGAPHGTLAFADPDLLRTWFA